jgi:hypothetical protein
LVIVVWILEKNLKPEQELTRLDASRHHAY